MMKADKGFKVPLRISQKVGITGLLLLLVILSVASVFLDLNISNPDPALAGYRSGHYLFDQAFSLKDQRPEYLSFLTRSAKTPVFISCLAGLADPRRVCRNLLATQNSDTALLIIAIFSVFYLLSRTSSETPASMEFTAL